jgi:hypothetical protein
LQLKIYFNIYFLIKIHMARRTSISPLKTV